jgi:hypothetical protein
MMTGWWYFAICEDCFYIRRPQLVLFYFCDGRVPLLFLFFCSPTTTLDLRCKQLDWTELGRTKQYATPDLGRTARHKTICHVCRLYFAWTRLALLGCLAWLTPWLLHSRREYVLPCLGLSSVRSVRLEIISCGTLRGVRIVLLN